MPSDSRLPKQFGKTVRELRLAGGWTQMGLAERADLTLNYIGEIERGEKLVSLGTIVKVAAALGTSGADLLRKSGL
jgi:transcriptional regulator with XRE-family HTH domain